jgi:hypothetical protein
MKTFEKALVRPILALSESSIVVLSILILSESITGLTSGFLFTFGDTLHPILNIFQNNSKNISEKKISDLSISATSVAASSMAF